MVFEEYVKNYNMDFSISMFMIVITSNYFVVLKISILSTKYIM